MSKETQYREPETLRKFRLIRHEVTAIFNSDTRVPKSQLVRQLVSSVKQGLVPSIPNSNPGSFLNSEIISQQVEEPFPPLSEPILGVAPIETTNPEPKNITPSIEKPLEPVAESSAQVLVSVIEQTALDSKSAKAEPSLQGIHNTNGIYQLSTPPIEMLTPVNLFRDESPKTSLDLPLGPMLGPSPDPISKLPERISVLEREPESPILLAARAKAEENAARQAAETTEIAQPQLDKPRKGRQRFFNPWIAGAAGLLGLVGIAVGLPSDVSHKAEALGTSSTSSVTAASVTAEIKVTPTQEAAPTPTATAISTPAATPVESINQLAGVSMDTTFTIANADRIDTIVVKPNTKALTAFGPGQVEIVFTKPDPVVANPEESSLYGLTEALIGQEVKENLGLEGDFDPALDAGLLNTEEGQKMLKEYAEPLEQQIIYDTLAETGNNPFTQSKDGRDVLIKHTQPGQPTEFVVVPTSVVLSAQQPQEIVPKINTQAQLPITPVPHKTFRGKFMSLFK